MNRIPGDTYNWLSDGRRAGIPTVIDRPQGHHGRDRRHPLRFRPGPHDRQPAVYLGPEAMNGYAVFLREFLHGWALWIARVVLLAAVILHIWSATSLTLDEPEGPAGRLTAEQKWRESTYASRTMRWSGVIIFVFVMYHLMHFTFGNAHPSFIEGDVYHNFIAGFRSCAGLARLHRRDDPAGPAHPARLLEHVPDARRLAPALHARWRTTGAWIFAAVIVLGNISFPLAVLAGSPEVSRREARTQRPLRPDREEVGEAPLRDEAGQPREQAQVHRDHGRLGPRRRRRRRGDGRARLQREVLLLPGLARGARTRSRRRAASTRRRTTATTATASSASSTTRSRAATSARARPTSTASPKISVNIIDQCVAQGVPFAREYGGLLDNRSFGGAQVSRTFYARGQTGQQLLLGAYQALERQIGLGQVEMYSRHEMLELDRRGRPRARHRRAGHGHRRDRDAPRPTRSAWRPAATATSSTSRPTPRAATRRRSGAPTRRARRSRTPASRRSIRPASPSPATTSRS